MLPKQLQTVLWCLALSHFWSMPFSFHNNTFNDEIEGSTPDIRPSLPKSSIRRVNEHQVIRSDANAENCDD